MKLRQIFFICAFNFCILDSNQRAGEDLITIQRVMLARWLHNCVKIYISMKFGGHKSVELDIISEKISTAALISDMHFWIKSNPL